MDKKIIFEFLTELSNNNSKEWMDEKREKYFKAKKIWLNEIQLILNRLAKYDSKLKLVQPKDTITRINNNRRFHPNKPVYKDYFSFTPYSGFNLASIHVSISPQKSFIGGGLYHPSPEILNKVREGIDYDGNELLKIIKEKNFIKFYGGIDEDPEQLKSAPKGYKKDHKYIDLLRRKNFTARINLTDQQVISDNFAALVENAFVSIKPLLEYLNRAIEFEEE